MRNLVIISRGNWSSRDFHLFWNCYRYLDRFSILILLLLFIRIVRNVPSKLLFPLDVFDVCPCIEDGGITRKHTVSSHC